MLGEGYDTAWIGAEGLDESCKWLRTRAQQPQEHQEGSWEEGYAGVLGMSQGAGMAYLLLRTGVVPRALLFSPVGPVHCETYIQTMLPTLLPPALSPSPSLSPLLVVWDPADTPSEDFIRDIIQPGPLGAHMQGVTHNGGHIVPQDVSAGKYAQRRYIVEAIVKWLAEEGSA